MRVEWGDLTVANTLILGYVIKVSLCFFVGLLSLRYLALCCLNDGISG